MSEEEKNYPSWVVPAEALVVRDKSGLVISVPVYPGHHVNRVTGEVTVMVADAEEEALAKGLKTEAAITVTVKDTGRAAAPRFEEEEAV